MHISLYSIPIGLYLLHTVLGGSVTFTGPRGANGAVATCTSNPEDNYDDKKVADLLQEAGIVYERVGNNFFIDDFNFTCDDFNFAEIRDLCQDPPVFGVATCKNRDPLI
ncbi:hypothetical protein VF21_01561 [Pseudogymnoascus sp. 05NY08]|nr:hypothetical protein VF21_01561 [Pseudogymnoascus sp. 05NY08]